MTSEEMTTGSVAANESERKYHTARSRWWNSTGGGSSARVGGPALQKGNIKAGDGGAKFRAEWPEVDKENWEWMKENQVDLTTGCKADSAGPSCGPQLGIPAGSGGQAHAVVDAVMQQRDAGRGWLFRNKLAVAGMLVFVYVLIARLLGEGESTGS